MQTPKLLVLLALIALAMLSDSVRANNEIFPATGAARDKVGWNNGYFLIEGKPVFLTAGEMHYARIPRELWRDRLWRTKQMGFNCVQMYVFWNAHEPKEGQWDFSDNLDLDAWLSLIQEMGMYGIVRVGPYSCAEWEHGGFPAWLTVKPGMVVRDMGEFVKYADRHLAKIYEIVAKHQIHKGGNVIMAQLENEHPKGWGTEKNPYLEHLYEKARKAGLEIPLFFSGLHHGSDPSGENPYKLGTTPWFSTEFWTGWIGKYGDMEPKMLNEKIRGTWKIMAFGGGGYDYYVVHGGSNFGYSGDSFEATYDYSSPIGEAGQFHNLYAPARRASQFAQSFSKLLTASANAPEFAKSTTGGRITTRQSPEGTIVFADNFQVPSDKNKAAQHIAPTAGAYQLEKAEPAKSDIKTRLQVAGLGEFPKEGDLVLHPHDLRTVLFGLPWTKSNSFECIASNVLMRQNIGGIDTWVCYGTPGDHGEIALKRSGGGGPSHYSFTYPKDESVQEIQIDSGDGSKALFLIMNTALADRTWSVKDKLVVGASFVRENGAVEMPEQGGQCTIYAASGKSKLSFPRVQTPALPQLAGWQWRDVALERKPEYDDSKWSSSCGPRPMECYDSYENRYGWYRTTLQGGKTLPRQLHFAGSGGELTAFLNGEPAQLNALSLAPGNNTLAILVKAGPRPKWYNFVAASGLDAARGVWGPVSTADKPFLTITDWKTHADVSKEPTTGFEVPEFDDSAWAVIHASNAHKQQPVDQPSLWLRAKFELTASAKSAFAWLPAHSSGSQTLFVNGKNVPLGKEQHHAVDLTPWLKQGTNCVALSLKLEKQRSKSQWIQPAMELWAANDPLPWKFRPGVEGLEETAIVGRALNWKAFLEAKPWNKETAPTPPLPRLWKTSFTYHPAARETIGLTTDGLKAGHVWLNGHNLGESPQKVPLYMPECWLKDGCNDLVVFDTHGAAPDQMKLQRYEFRQVK